MAEMEGKNGVPCTACMKLVEAEIALSGPLGKGNGKNVGAPLA